jgi:hypothetical protein
MNNLTTPFLVPQHQSRLRTTADNDRLVRTARRVRRASKRQADNLR